MILNWNLMLMWPDYFWRCLCSAPRNSGITWLVDCCCKMILHSHFRGFSFLFVKWHMYLSAWKHFVVDEMICKTRLEVFIHIWFLVFKETKVEWGALCPKTTSWWQCFQCSSNILNPILFTLMLVLKAPDPFIVL